MGIKKAILSTSLALLLGSILAVWNASSRAESQADKLVPFTAHSTQVDRGSDGSVHFTMNKLEGIRSDGSYSLQQARIIHRLNQAVTEKVIWDKETGRKTFIEPSITARSSTRFNVNKYSAPVVGCGSLDSQGSKVGEYLGYQILETVEEFSDAGRHRIFRRGYAPDLGCFLMYAELETRDLNGNVLATSSYQVNEVVPGEPNPELFNVPEDYAEMSPSELMTAQMEQRDFPQEQMDYHLSLPGVVRSETNYVQNRWD